MIKERKQDLLHRLSLITNEDAILLEGRNKSILLQNRSDRGSRYRGVSKNGSKWQVIIVGKDIKKYIGAIDSEDKAGLLYDKYAMII